MLFQNVKAVFGSRILFLRFRVKSEKKKKTILNLETTYKKQGFRLKEEHVLSDSGKKLSNPNGFCAIKE